jgi:hypothetical protein
VLLQADERDRDNAPRFTLAELREVLHEKNALKGRVLELEDEIEQMRVRKDEYAFMVVVMNK